MNCTESSAEKTVTEGKINKLETSICFHFQQIYVNCSLTQRHLGVFKIVMHFHVWVTDTADRGHSPHKHTYEYAHATSQPPQCLHTHTQTHAHDCTVIRGQHRQKHAKTLQHRLHNGPKNEARRDLAVRHGMFQSSIFVKLSRFLLIAVLLRKKKIGFVCRWL